MGPRSWRFESCFAAVPFAKGFLLSERSSKLTLRFAPLSIA